ncbi:hypothetical protein [Pseudoalteromonas sp. R3]|uniref:hypothetical protein n=1 Tax=Pseudoalteromonas sp. R3 TaxID=1709477 RepID=UPI0006B4D9F0|nr:hypothetical protein [Pseudoalteromonas sp. R3]AZZ98462.1 hypothetical protein ELR70_15890 [Pseudoalteromonas sp. R3]
MRIILVLCFLWANSLLACGKDETAKIEPFAKMEQDYNFENLIGYEVFVPEMSKGYYLTSFYLGIKDSVAASLDFSEAFGYKGYYSVIFQVKPEKLDALSLTLSYSTTKDKKGMVLCGEQVQLNLKELLNAKQPKMVVPPPPPPREVNNGV